ncbi:MAG: pseudouridine synthase [Bacteroidales bacterium]|nr:pseudouridine synthase [Bacteroidales bacterium]
MEDNKNGGYSAEGRKLRPRKKVSFENTERRSDYGHRNESGERRSFDGGERRSYNKPYGERRSYGEGGERRPYGQGERRQGGYGERRNFSDGGERRPYGGNAERRPYNKPYGERRSYGEGGEHRSFNKPYGERKSYGEGGEHRSYNKPYGERRSFGEGGEHRSFNKPYGERRSFGEDGGKRPYNGGGRKPYGAQQGPKPVRGKGRKKFEPQFDESPESGIYRMIERRPNIDASNYSDNDYVKTPIQNEIRLNKFIANSGVCSRREADTFIQAGVVTVNGEVVTELGTKVNVLTDDVRFNGERLKGEEKVYIVMNKPKGYVTTSSDPHAGKTVMDLLKGCDTRVFPVGRLDKATTGVLMFTNDGEIAERLTHPSYDKKKIYQVILDRELSQEDYASIMTGVELSDGEVSADELEYIDATDHRRLGIEIHSGKNRIVRRIFESLGYTVKALDRVYFAGLTKKGLNKGEWRYLTEGEVNILKMGAYV